MRIVPGEVCSFCGEDAANVQGLGGALGVSPLICEQCLRICVDIFADPDHAAGFDEFVRLRRLPEPACSYCDGRRREAKYLASGPGWRIFICQDCAREGAALFGPKK